MAESPRLFDEAVAALQAMHWRPELVIEEIPAPQRIAPHAVAVAAGWPSGDGGAFLDNYLRVTRRAKTVVRKVFGE